VGLSGTGTITGQVVDGGTRAPIADAEVTLVLNGAKYAVQSSASPDPDLTGTFSFSDVPSGFHLLKIAAADYAAWQAAVLVSPSQDGTPHTENLGKIGLGQTFALIVVTTADGSPLADVTVLAEPNGATPDCGYQTFYSWYPPNISVSPFDASDLEVSVVTDGNGRGTFAGLNQCLRYLLVALPHDGNNDGTYDHTATSAVYEGATNSDRTIALALRPTRRDDAIAIVGTNMDRNLRVAFLARNLSDTGPDPGSNLSTDGAGCVSYPYSVPCPSVPIITPDYPNTGIPSTRSGAAFKLVFNYPVSATGATVTYLDDLVNPDADNDDVVDQGFPVKRAVSATVALDATGTILTVTPRAGFPRNETVTVGPISAVVNGVTTTVNQDVYVEDDATSGLSASTVITADTYSYCDPAAIPYPYPYPCPPYGQPFVYLEFPEYVTGTYRVVSYTTSTGTVAVDGPIIQIGPLNYYSSQGSAAGEMVYTDGAAVPACSQCGTGAGVIFRVPVSVLAPSGYYPPSITLADGDELRVEVDVRDAVGNRLSREFALTVQ
jgi:hypothetical protein